MNRSNSPLNSSNTSGQQSKQYYTGGNKDSKSRSISPNQMESQQPRQRSQQPQNQIFAPILQPQQPHMNQSFSQINPNNVSRQSQISSVSQMNSSYLYIPCPSHPDLFITNICRTRECVEPLCPECITVHLEMHTRKGGVPKIENIQRVRRDCIQSVYQQMERLSKDSADLKQHGMGSQQTHYQSCIDNMRVQHQRMLEMVDDYFEYLEKELKEKMRGLEQLQKQYVELENLVKEDVKQLDGLAGELQGQNYVRFVIQQLEDEQNNLGSRKIKELESAIAQYQEQLPMIANEETIYEKIKSEMSGVCYITNKSQIKKPAQTLYKNEIASIDVRRQQASQMQGDGTLPKQSILSHIPETAIQGKEERNVLNIDIEDHLEKINDSGKFVLTLEEDTKKLHLMYIYDKESKIQTFTLTIDFRIPVNHRQIQCSNGIIILTGGIYREKNRFKSSDQVYRLDFDEMTLKPCQPMNFARAMHQLCEIGGKVYAVGGTQTNDENSSINKCETYDIQTGRWTPITDCKYKTSGSCLQGVNHKYMVKIGGKLDIFTPCSNIEIYNIEQDFWNDLEYQFSGAGLLRLPFNACALTINKREIIIFGGSVHDVKSNEASILRLPEQLQGQAIINLTKSLPRAVEFNTQTGLLDYNNIWIFEDIGGKKRVLNGSGAGWKEL